MNTNALGKIIILNGAPRSGKSSIARELQKDAIWINIGVDNYMRTLPPEIMPGIGLRPGGEHPDLEKYVLPMYHALYQNIANHSRLGFNVVVDVGHHDNYATLTCVFSSCLKILSGLPYFVVGIECPIEEIIIRRAATGYPCTDENGNIPTPILLWQEYIHKGKEYDLVLDTSKLSVNQCVGKMKSLLNFEN